MNNFLAIHSATGNGALLLPKTPIPTKILEWDQPALPGEKALSLPVTRLPRDCRIVRRPSCTLPIEAACIFVLQKDASTLYWSKDRLSSVVPKKPRTAYFDYDVFFNFLGSDRRVVAVIARSEQEALVLYPACINDSKFVERLSGRRCDERNENIVKTGRSTKKEFLAFAKKALHNDPGLAGALSNLRGVSRRKKGVS